MQKRLLILLMVVFGTCSLIAQPPYVYTFNNNFNEQGAGPALNEVLETGGGCTFEIVAPGSFNSQTINSACVGSPVTRFAFDFNQGGAVAFDNSADVIGPDYTISIVFKFNSYAGGQKQRIIDFSNGTRENGLYIDAAGNLALSSGQGGVVVGAPFTFVANVFTMVTLVRDATSNLVSAYINGDLYSILDISATAPFDPYNPTSAAPINVFLDQAGDCEDGAGTVSYLTLNPLAETAGQVLNDYNNTCFTVLPLHLLDFSADKQNSSVALNWATENELNTSHFEVERSADGRNFSKLSDVSAINSTTRRNYSFIDRQPLSGTDFYRLKMLDMDGHFKYSGILKINFTGSPQFEVYPNPVKDIITIGGIRGNGNIRLINAEGRQVLQKISAGQSMTVDVSKYPSGVYVVLYSDGEKTQSQKILKE